MLQPIKLSLSRHQSTKSYIASQNLTHLRNLLKANNELQINLKKIRTVVRGRMRLIEDFTSTYQLKKQHPEATQIISYMKFQRNIPKTIRDLSRLAPIKKKKKQSNNQDEREFLKKLNGSKPLKKNKKIQISISDLPEDPRSINFVGLAKDGGYINGLQLYQKWIEVHTFKKIKQPYTRDQQLQLIELQRLHGDNWQKICQKLQTRHFQQIYYEFHNRINPKILTGRWNTHQTLMLLILIEHFGIKRWALIGKKMVIKSELQVRERFCNILDPNIGRDSHWNPDMDRILIETALEKNFCWKDLAKLPIFQRRTDNNLWRRFRAAMIKKSEEQIKAIIPPTNNRGLIQKLLKFKNQYESKARIEQNKKIQFDPNARAKAILANANFKGDSSIDPRQMSSIIQVICEQNLSEQLKHFEELQLKEYHEPVEYEESSINYNRY